MSCVDWYVGMQVVCTDSDVHGKYTPWPAVGDLDGLTVGVVYTIRKIGVYRGMLGIWLSEIVRTAWIEEGEPPFSVRRFRPVQHRKADISIFTAMLTGAKERERA